jgi:hypothetical protein
MKVQTKSQNLRATRLSVISIVEYIEPFSCFWWSPVGRRQRAAGGWWCMLGYQLLIVHPWWWWRCYTSLCPRSIVRTYNKQLSSATKRWYSFYMLIHIFWYLRTARLVYIIHWYRNSSKCVHTCLVSDLYGSTVLLKQLKLKCSGIEYTWN